MSISHNKPVILTLGATGQLGKMVADQLLKEDSISLRVTSRKKEQLPTLKDLYNDAVFMDLDDPRTFDTPLKGVDRLFLLTGGVVA